jgi:hypothetical protein
MPIRRFLFLLAAFASLLLVTVGTVDAHSNPCHTSHACPSDHHSYIWKDASGLGWDCAKADATDLTSADTHRVVVSGLVYFCRAAGSAPGSTTPSSPTPPSGSTSVGQLVTRYPWGKATRTSGCHVRGAYPDPACSPGAVYNVTAAQVCVSGYSARVRNVPDSVKNAVYASYGIRSHSRATYEMDHIVSLELGGSNENNLFPEAASPKPGYHEKDQAENFLHREMCAGRMSLAHAQDLIAHHWLDVYRGLPHS